MAMIRLTATAGADGVLRLALPVGAGEYEVAVEVRPKSPAPPVGLAARLDALYGSITDDSFEAPPRHPPRPVEPLDAE